MNNYSVCAWLDDLQMSTQLIKFANIHSCDLNFIDNDIIVSKNKISTVLIVDLMRLSENDLNNLSNFHKIELLTIIGYLHKVAGPHVKYYQKYGCHMVIGRNELLKNLNAILKKIFHAD